MEWVFDTSITMAWCFEDERTDETDALLDRLASGSAALVPQVWPLEVANVLTQAARKGRVKPAKSRQFLAMLESAAITVDLLPIASVFNEILQLAGEHHLTSYDASYLELAMRTGLPIATLDKALRRAANRAGVGLL
jgi:predicted nucleic acid-binding protein